LGETRPIAYSRTDAYGNYAIVSGLSPGSYTVICDFYGYNHEEYPLPVMVDLIDHPEATDINFELIPVTTGIAFENEPMTEIELLGNYPNPFNKQTVITFYSVVDEGYFGRVSVYNLLGQRVESKKIEITPGRNEFIWDVSALGRDASSGVYYYKIDGSSSVGRMILLK
jgi:hypothetical protein